jgi:cellulose synthase (UDP-forming)
MSFISKNEVSILRIRLLITFTILIMVMFCYFFFKAEHIGNAVLYGMLTGALVYKLMRMVFEWYHYYNLEVPVLPEMKREYTVDMLTTFCKGEPYDMVIRTLKAMKAVIYPHETYLCDEADDQYLKQFCLDNGIHHITRTLKVDAKAGNINNALRSATGEICVVMDPDHIPVPNFLERVLPYFENEKVGYVQCVQGYYNQRESLVAQAAAEQTYHFYGPIMICMGNYNTAQAIGANCTFRRKALDSIGGHAAGLSEDMHTAMRIHAQGWKSVYTPEPLSYGLVPTTLSGFYKQQIKWSRGTFELLFTTYFKIFWKLSFRQKLHYYLAPMYYLYGITGAIDILIPILSLAFTETPWEVRMPEFIQLYLPLLIMSMVIRLYAQRWLIHKRERGLHLLGGILRFGSWWVFLIGFVYSLLRINVPYIPTAKGERVVNEWKICLPNIILIILSVFAIVYGLYQDLNPYSLTMASFAFVNIIFLSLAVLMGQQKMINNIKSRLARNSKTQLIKIVRRIEFKTINFTYKIIQRSAITIGLSIAIILLALSGWKSVYYTTLASLSPLEKIKSHDDFYLGIYIPGIEISGSLADIKKYEKQSGSRFNLVSYYEAWNPSYCVLDYNKSFIDSIYNHNGIPMITWEPWTSSFPQFANDPDLSKNRKVFKAIIEGKFDTFINDYARKLQALDKPVFLRFAHEPDNPAFPWSSTGGNTADEYKLAWIHIIRLFNKQGVSNVAWVWNPWTPKAIQDYYPGETYVDWVGITSLNYGKASLDGNWYSFNSIYAPYKKEIASLNKPVMMAEFGSTSYGGDKNEWINDALKNIEESHQEIKAIVFFNTVNDKNWATSWRPSNKTEGINWSCDFTSDLVNKQIGSLSTSKRIASLKSSHNAFKELNAPNINNAIRSKSIRKEDSLFTFIVDHQPFYIKAVAYNTGSDWRDGDVALSLDQLKEDFAKMKDMGANTIRRYDHGLYDNNILQVANKNNLKVIFGFWFDPEVDYFQDSLQVNAYVTTVLEKVKKYKNSPAVLAWSLGNEAWGTMKHHFAKPYLTKVRREYLNMIEFLTQEIHRLDTLHPVMTCIEHSEELSSEMKVLGVHAPSLDIVGVNSFYFQRLSELNSIALQFNQTRPYFVSEFGPAGYWDEYLTQRNEDSSLKEDYDYVKAGQYEYQWQHYILQNKGFNIGGDAYCWHDRMEGSATWFGLTDYKGRMKPAYFAMQRCWKETIHSDSIPPVYIVSSKRKIMPGQYYEFRPWCMDSTRSDLKYEWFFRREEYLENLQGLIRTFDEGKRILLKVPEVPSHYRLYLYASDNKGRVVTNSYPILVKNFKEN